MGPDYLLSDQTLPKHTSCQSLFQVFYLKKYFIEVNYHLL